MTTEKLDLPVYPLSEPDASAAKTGTRSAYWPEYGARRDTPVYAFATLKPGTPRPGPRRTAASTTATSGS